MKNKEYIQKKLDAIIKQLQETATIDLTPENIVADLEEIKTMISSQY